MTLKSSTRFFNGALLAGAMALISTEAAVAQPAPGTADSSVRLVQTWDKTFPRSEKVDHQKVTFKNRYGITLAADVYLPIFPTHWFNITPMMKAYMNDTWGSVGPDLWKGKEMLIVTTAAGDDSTYGKNGRTGTELADVFTPMKASALHAGMTWLPPLVFQGVRTSQLPEYQRQLIERLTK